MEQDTFYHYPTLKMLLILFVSPRNLSIQCSAIRFTSEKIFVQHFPPSHKRVQLVFPEGTLLMVGKCLINDYRRVLEEASVNLQEHYLNTLISIFSLFPISKIVKTVNLENYIIPTENSYVKQKDSELTKIHLNMNTIMESQ